MASWQKVGCKVHWMTVFISISTALYNRTNSARCHKWEPGYGIGVRCPWSQFVNVSGVWISSCFLYSYYLSFSRASTRTNDHLMQYLTINQKQVHMLDKRISILRQQHDGCTLIKIGYKTDREIDGIWNKLGSKEPDQRNSWELIGNGIDDILGKRTSWGEFWAAWWICSVEHMGSYQRFTLMIECLFVYWCSCDRDKCENLMDFVCMAWCCPPGRTVCAIYVIIIMNYCPSWTPL